MKLKILLLIIGMLILASGTVYFFIKMGSPVLMLSLLVVPIGVFFLNRPKLLYASLICTSFSNITVPGLPGALKLFHVLAVGALVISLMVVCINKEFRKPLLTYQKLALLFCLNLFIIILYRGFSLRTFGGDEWGGMRYLEVLIPLGLLFVTPPFTYSRRDWILISIWFLIFSALPIISEMVFLLSGGSVYHQFYLIQIKSSTIHSFMADEAGRELVRFQSANRLGPILILASMVILLHSKKITAFLIFYISGVLLIGISGHRSGFIDVVVLTWITGFILFKNNKIEYLFVSFVGAMASVVIIYNVSMYLPYGFQRALSILPGIRVSPDVELDAFVSTNWRLGVWHEALTELRMNPDYYFIGKGLTYSAKEFNALQHFDFNYWWAIITSTYHQGVLSLLIITGISGLTLVSGFFITFLLHHYKIQKNMFRNTFVEVLHLVCFIYTIVIIVKFYLIYGDLPTSLPSICYFILVMRLLADSSKNLPFDNSYKSDSF